MDPKCGESRITGNEYTFAAFSKAAIIAGAAYSFWKILGTLVWEMCI